jgi:hypothetical protein
MIAITSPAPGTVFTAPATVTIQASATDVDGSVTNVNFLVNGALVGAATTSPFTVTVSNLAAGDYVLRARARDDAGVSTKSPPVTITVHAPAPLAGLAQARNPSAEASATSPTATLVAADLRLEAKLAGGGRQVAITLPVAPGHRYAVERSETFTRWTVQTQVVAVSDSFTFFEPLAGMTQHFFRARLLPDP